MPVITAAFLILLVVGLWGLGMYCTGVSKRQHAAAIIGVFLLVGSFLSVWGLLLHCLLHCLLIPPATVVDPPVPAVVATAQDHVAYTASVPRSGKWPAVRRAHLAAHPCCEVCGCKTDLNVHHVEPFHLNPAKENDPDNLITLGEACPTGNHHLLFGHLGNWSSYNRDVRGDAATWRCKIEERP